MHLKPLPDELLSSWIVRLAAANGLKLYTFCSLAWPGRSVWSRDIDKSADNSFLAVLAEKTATPPDRVAATCLAAYEGVLYETHNPQGTTPWILPLGIFHSLRKRFGLQYCPQCLACDPIPYFRRAWRTACFTVCIDHGVALRDRCPYCEAPVIFHRGDWGDRNKWIPDPVTSCYRCRGDLRDAAVELADPDEVGLQRRIVGLIHTGWVRMPGRDWIYTHLYFTVLRHLMRLLSRGRHSTRFREAACEWLGHPHFPTVYPSGCKDIEHLDVALRRPLLQLAMRLLDTWPEGFVEMCAANRIWSSTLLRDLRTVPFWYWDVVHEHLYRTSASPMDEEIAWLRAHNTGIFGAVHYTPPKRYRRRRP